MVENLVIIPTYNEIENVDRMIREIFELEQAFHLLIIDDSSPDGTGEKVKKLQIEFPEKLHLEIRTTKLGLGKAYIHGFKWALEKKYNYIFEMDCDFSHSPNDLIKLLNACQQDADLAIGSRYCKNGKIKNWPWNRILISYFASVYVRLILWIPLKDTTSGFKCYRRKVLEAIDLNQINFMGYAFQIEMKYRAYKKGFKLKEIPITFVDRVLGISKMSSKIFKEAFFGVIQMRFIKKA